jgi:hypothetical protein
MDMIEVIKDMTVGTIGFSLIVIVCGYISQAITTISPDAGAQFDGIMLPAINLISALPTDLFLLLVAILGALGAVGVVKSR